MLGRQGTFMGRNTLENELRHINASSADIQSAIAKAQESGFIEPVLELLGAQKIDSLDFSDYERATIVHDMNEPVPESLKGKFSCVFDGGTLEHVFDFPQAIKNAMELVAVGGHFLGVAPANNYPGHGFYQFSPELYWRVFSEANGYVVEEVAVCETRRNAPCYIMDDPAKVGHRVQFTNSRPTYVMIRARCLRRTEIFKTPPQQPFYEARWSPQTGEGHLQSGSKRLRDRAKPAPELVKRVLSLFASDVSRLRSAGFEKF
jgi:SAM-dependent methyltransferase